MYRDDDPPECYNRPMRFHFAPTQYDWQLYEDRCREAEAEWLRSLTTEKSLALYSEMCRLANSQRDDSPGWQGLEEQRWAEKVAIRKKMVSAFQSLDRIRGERRGCQDAR
jgi:hypothetical protein